MQAYFFAIADFIQSRLAHNEQFTCWLAAEASDFVRFNRGAIRQPGHVRQLYLNLQLINGLRHANSSITLAGNPKTDQEMIRRMVFGLRTQLAELPEDPHLLIATEVNSTEHLAGSRLPSSSAIIDEIMSEAKSYDFVGILAAGPIYRGFANSFGQRNWHESASFNLDWSVYQSNDKAVKTAYAGFDWDGNVFRDKFHQAVAQLALLQRTPVTLDLGAYRAYFTPAALGELAGMLNWDGLSEKSLRTKRSSLRKMRDEGWRLNPAVTLAENSTDGMAPAFQREGFIKPGCLTLIDHGRLIGSMIAPRTAKEYGITANGANGSETLAAMDIKAGELPASQVLSELDTGIYLSNLWYLNYSERANCRITGMTRFASFWVENGKIQAPLNVMRFDDSLLRVLGENLLGLTRERELLVDSESYGQRGTNSKRLPGALVKELNFVL